MNFQAGDTVMHWSYGLGQILRLEERDLAGSISMYYAVKVRELTVWVPADSNLGTRLRTPTTQSAFKKLLAIFALPAKPLPEDKQLRKAKLLELTKGGSAESLCQIIRDLTGFKKDNRLNDNDQSFLDQARSALLAEWSFVRSVPVEQAELELRNLLGVEPIKVNS